MLKFFHSKHHKHVSSPKPTPVIKDNGQNNVISIGSGFDVSKINITIVGDNNTIELKNTKRGNVGPLTFRIHANNSRIVIDEDLFIDGGGLNIELGNMMFEAVDNSFVTIGAHTGIGGGFIIMYNSNAGVKIGRDVMMAFDIMLYNTDAHPIYSNGQIANKVQNIEIGDKCWIGARASILKNVRLANGTIVGYGAVVAKSFDEPYIAIAGNPAKKIKSGLTWKEYDSEYIKNVNN